MTAIVPLAELQRRFCAWLTEPDEDRAVHLAQTLDVGPGLVVYQNNYRTSLIEALRVSHPRAAAWLGEPVFNAHAARHIDAHPPSSWTIDAYGDQFPAALRADDPLAGDLAAIDRAVSEAFVAADAVPATPAALAQIDWDSAVIRPVPSLVIVPVTTNAYALWLALANNSAVPDPAPAPGTLLVWRQQFEPVMRRADASECLMLHRSLAGTSFAAICETFAHDSNEAEAATRAGTVLGRWLGEGLVAGFG